LLTPETLEADDLITLRFSESCYCCF